MGKVNKEDVVRDLIVVWWDGFGQEHQVFDPEARLWEFSKSEAEEQCKKFIKRGAVKVEAWRPAPTPEKVAAYKRTSKGSCEKTYPRS